MITSNSYFGSYALRAYIFMAAFAFFIVSGCAEQPVKPVVEEEPKKIVLLPVFSVIKEFRQYDEMVHRRLINQLQNLGHEPIVIADEQYQLFRKHALEQSGSIYNPAVGDFIPYDEQVYVAKLVLQLSKSIDFDLLMLPELSLRAATVDGDMLVWDGVRMPQVIKGGQDKTFRSPDKARGLSLKIAIYTRAGRELVKHYTGVAVPYYLDLQQSPVRYRLRKQLFDDDQLNTSIALALKTLQPRSQ